MPEYMNLDGNLNNYHDSEEFNRSMEKLVRRIIRKENKRFRNRNIRIKTATVTAVDEATNTVTIQYTTAEAGATIPSVAVQEGFINDDGTLRIAVNDVVEVLVVGSSTRIVLF